jgi:hypothetical protein
MDDCVLNTLYSGTLSMGPVTTSPGYSISYPNTIYAHGMVWLYSAFPGWSWHGIALILLNIIAIVLIIRWLDKSLAHWFSSNRIYRGLLITSLSCVFFLEPLVLMTYTSTAVLLAGSCFIYACDPGSNNKYYTMKLLCLSLLFLASFCLRFQAALFTIALLALLYVFIAQRLSLSKRKVIVSISILSITLIGYLFHTVALNNDQKEIESFDKYYFSFFEGNSIRSDIIQLNDNHLELKIRALKAWFFNDEKVFNTSFLKQITYDSPFNLSNLSNWNIKLKRSYYLAFDYRDPSYLYYTNWGWQGLVALIINSFLLGIVMGSPMSMSEKIRAILFNITFWGAILAICIILLMRHRVFVPIIGLYSIIHLLWVFKLIKKYSDENYRCVCSKLMFGVCVIMTLIKLPCIEISAKQKQQELQSKNTFISNMNTLRGKTIVFDTYSLCLLNNNAIQMPFISKENELVTTGDYFQRFFTEYKTYWIQQCGSADFLRIITYLQAHKSNVVFVSEPDHMQLMSEYLNTIYSQPFHHQTLTNTPSIGDNFHSILPLKIDIKYYQIAE